MRSTLLIAVAALAAAVLAAAGCGTNDVDPCAGQAAVCLTVEVTGNAPVLDELDLSVQIGVGQRLTGRAVGVPSDIRLPVRFAALLPSSTAGPIAIEVVGARVGIPLVYGAAATIVPPSGQKVVVKVASLAVDMGNTPVDLSHFSIGNDLSTGGGDMGVPPIDFSTTSPDDMATSTCQRTTCVAMSAFCGTPSDGCGGTLNCGGPCVLGNFATVANMTLAPPRLAFGAVSTGSRVYIVGGQDSTRNPTASVQMSNMKADGTLGPFTNVAALGSPRGGVTAALTSSYLYAIGGDTGTTVSTPTNSIERAALLSGGTLSTWSNAGITLGSVRMFMASAVVGNFVYVLGGYNSGTGTAVVNTVERATISVDGTLGSFAPAGTSLSVARAESVAIATSGYVYVFGGTDGMKGLSSVERAVINGDGSLGAFADAGFALPEALDAPAVQQVSSEVYLIGGGFSSDDAGTPAYLTQVYASSIGIGGLLSSFSSAFGVTMRTGSAGHTAVLVGSSVYLLGGLNVTLTAAPVLNRIERAPLQ